MSKYKPLGIDDIMPFGKHKGLEIGTIIDEFPDYLDWCIKNIETFELDTQAQAMLTRELAQRKKD